MEEGASGHQILGCSEPPAHRQRPDFHTPRPASLGFGDFAKGTNGNYVKVRGRYVPTRADGVVTARAALVRLEMNGRAPIDVQPVAAFGLKFFAVTIPPPDALKLRAIALYDRHGKLIVRVPRDQGSRWR